MDIFNQLPKYIRLKFFNDQRLVLVVWRLMLLENRITNIILLHLVLSLNNYAMLQISIPAADFVVLIHEVAARNYV